jgi:hypothetical protein
VNDKPFAESCVQNRDPIPAVLAEVPADRRRVLEIGSGTASTRFTSAPSCRTV